MSPANRPRCNVRWHPPAQRPIHSGFAVWGRFDVTVPGSGESESAADDPVALVAQLMQWLVARGKAPVIRPGQLSTVIGLSRQLLETMDIRPACVSHTFEPAPLTGGANHKGTGAVHDDYGIRQGQGLKPEFSSADWDAFAEALRLGKFDRF
jgi:hypothetical protein